MHAKSAGEWDYYDPLFFSVRLIDGTRHSGLVMRRRNADGQKEYRRMTPEEESEYSSMDRW